MSSVLKAARPSIRISRRHYSVKSLEQSSQEAPRGALDGVKILDLSRVLAAPFCTQILADYGANVIKVEAIGKGDDTRHWRMTGEQSMWKKGAGPMSNYFSAVNRNKRSITLDLKHPQGKAILLKLAKEADVLVENFKPGTMDRLGLGYEQLKEHNKRLIFASLSGYGSTGPYSNRGGYDPIAGAEAGLIHVTGERNGPPVRPGLGVVDMATGLYLHGAIVAALFVRQRDGHGQQVGVSLFETQLSMLTNIGLSWLNMGIEAERWGCQHPSIVPYDAYQTKDLYLVCGATNDAQFATLSRILGLEWLCNDERFSSTTQRVKHRELLAPILNDVFKTKTTEEWIKVFEGKNLAFAPINNMERAFSHPQAEARNMIAKVAIEATESGQMRLIGPAVKFSKTEASIKREPPRLGQHTGEILAEIEIGEDEAQNLRQEGVVG